MHRPLEEIQAMPQDSQSRVVERSAGALTRPSVPYEIVQKFSIVHVVRQYAPSVGGLENAVRGLARVQRDAGHRVKIITLNRLFTAPETILPDHDVIDGIDVVRIPFFGSSRYPIAASIKRWLDDQDIIHVHGVDFFFDYLAMSKPKSAIVQVASTHGGFFHTSFAKRLKLAFFHSITRLSSRAYDAIVCVSRSDLDRFSKIAHGRTLLIENGIDTSKFRGAASHHPQKTLITWSRWTKHKCLGDVLNLLRILRDNDAEWKLIVAGSPSELSAQDLDREVRQSGLTDAVEIIERPSDAELRQAITRASIFVSASQFEGFGIAAVEAMSAGLPVVLSDIDAHRHLIAESSAGLLADFSKPDDSAARTAELFRRLEDQSCRLNAKAMSRSCNWDWPTIGAQTLDLYFSAAGLTPRNILGIDVAPLKRDGAVGELDTRAERGQNTCVAFANAHTLNTVHASSEVKSALQSFLVLNDGAGINWASKRLYKRGFDDNLNGTDFVPYYLQQTRHKKRIFLFGGQPGVARRAAEELLKQAPQHQIAGTSDGFIEPEDWPALAARIKALKTDTLLVALGNPKQELWINEHMIATGCQEAFGVGALFDFLAGNVPRAPLWMQRLGLEWTYRLVQEPFRLWRRYLIGNPIFMSRVLKQQAREGGRFTAQNTPISDPSALRPSD